MKENWIEGAIKRPGAFTKKAESRGLSVAAFARRVLDNPGRYDDRTVKQARLAKTLRKMS